MKLAALGIDSDLLALLAAATAEGHHIVWLGDVRPGDEPALRQLTALSATRSASWETLLDHTTADAVLIGRGLASDDLREEQLKRLVTDAVPLLVVQPTVLSVLIYYELDMVRRETRGVLRHYNPLIDHPALADIARWVHNGHESIGPIVQVICTRHVSEGGRESALAGLARDAELLAAVVGDIRKVSAIGPNIAASGANASYMSLQVQMTTPAPASVRWSITPQVDTAGGIELTLVGEKGTIVWNPNRQVLTIGTEVSALSSFNAPLLAIQQLVICVEHPDIITDVSKPVTRSTWDKATRAMEVVDAVELSLQKGRTIEVHQQQLTEQLAFRGTMAALGCGLLLVATLVVIVAGLVGSTEWLHQQPLLGAWPLLLLAVLAFFLLLQFVPLLASKRSARPPDARQQELPHD